MPRLPQPGSDDGSWGNILNEYLLQSHKPDGTLKDSVVTSAAFAPNSVTSSALAANAVNASAIQNGTLTEQLLTSSVQTKLNASGTGTKVLGMAESYVNYAQIGSSNQLVEQCSFTSTGATCRVRVIGGSVTAVAATVIDWTIIEGVSTKIIRHVTQSLGANVADSLPVMERIWEPTAGYNSVRLYLKLTPSKWTTINNNPASEESPLQIIVEELSL